MATHTGEDLPVRRTVRLVLLNDRNELLLMKVALPDRSFWCTIGGGVKAGETPEAAARREVHEEIGFVDADLVWGPCLWYGEHVMARGAHRLLHKETFVLARTVRTDLHTEHMSAAEKQVVKAFKWWSLDELRTTAERVVPPSLVHHLGSLLAGQVPDAVLTIDLGDTPRGGPKRTGSALTS